jgi:hypothetical protein
MKSMIQFMIIAILLMVTAPAFAGSAVSVYNCQQADDASEEDVIATANAWLADAKGIKGGENLQVRVMFPVAATLGDNDFLFVVIAPSFTEWGVFQDAFTGSASADDDKKYSNIAQCNDSALWESFGG